MAFKWSLVNTYGTYIEVGDMARISELYPFVGGVLGVTFSGKDKFPKLFLFFS